MDGITKWEGLAVEKLRYIYPIDAEVTASMLTFPWVMDGITAGESSAISSVFSLMNEYPPFAKEVLDLWWVPDDMPTVERYALRDLHDLARSNLPLARQAIGEPFMGPALAQAGQQHVAGVGGDGQQRVIAPRTGVAVVAGALLGQSVGLADRRIKVDGEWCVAGSGTRPSRPGPATSRLTRSSWRTWPHLKLRRKVPRVEGALAVKPSTRAVQPARSTSASSMQSPPARACPRESGGRRPPRVIILSPVFARPGAPPRSRCFRRSWGRPRRRARVAGRTSPGIGHQAVVVEGDLDAVGVVTW